jgi:serine/threonine protein kinase
MQVLKVVAPNERLFAIKVVKLNNLDRATRNGFFEEVALLEKLRNKPGVIRIVDHEHDQERNLLYVVLEYGEIDLLRLLHNKRKQWQGQDPFMEDAHFIGAIWRDLLRAVKVCTKESLKSLLCSVVKMRTGHVVNMHHAPLALHQAISVVLLQYLKCSQYSKRFCGRRCACGCAAALSSHCDCRQCMRSAWCTATSSLPIC